MQGTAKGRYILSLEDEVEKEVIEVETEIKENWHNKWLLSIDGGVYSFAFKWPLV